ncbi:MAG: hypothetical protein HFI51_14260 [Lachnospiraceae bacterium]|nr:hypothetical protein [Lachnospiraceae bacterium]
MKETKDNKKNTDELQVASAEPEFPFISSCTPDLDLEQIEAEERFQEF